MNLLRWRAIYKKGTSVEVYDSGEYEVDMSWEELPHKNFLALAVIYQETHRTSRGLKHYSDVFYGFDYVLRVSQSIWENRSDKPIDQPPNTWREGTLLPDSEWERIRIKCHRLAEVFK